MENRFGQEIRKRRLAAGLSLRSLAERLGVSASHLSDIEHEHRRPSETLFLRILVEFQDIGTETVDLKMLMTGLDEETRRWVTTTPGARELIRRIIATGRTPAELISYLDKKFPR
jgi:transcriptional regulator with XRE-family HTH domain